MSSPGRALVRSATRDASVKDTKLQRGTGRRVLGYGLRYKGLIAGFLVFAVLDSVLSVATPLLLRTIIDDGVIPGDRRLVVWCAVAVAVLAVLSAVVAIAGRSFNARIGERLIYDLRTEVFDHVLRQPVAFFTRTQTGALVTRLNTDVIGAQSTFSTTLGSLASNLVSLVLILAAMLSMSWQLTLAALVLVPIYLVPARVLGQRLGGLMRAQMKANAELGSRMTERFNVAGALLVKLFGNERLEHEGYAERAAVVRDSGVKIAMTRVTFNTTLTFVAALATALVYGFGGLSAVAGDLTVGSLVALTALLQRLYQPLMGISSARVDIMSALVSFERVFEVLDLQPLVSERVGARPLPQGALSVELDEVDFGYPGADEVSLASLEQVGSGDRAAGEGVLKDITLRVEPGQMVALVGPSGAGKSTLTALVARLYDPTSGVVRVGGVDLREATLDSVRESVGMVTQEAHMFHDTIAANLRYARPEATEEQIWAALEAAQIAPLVRSLPQGLDTVVGDRGHRLSGGEKQRLAIARLLLKGPGVVVLDEATAHLDSEHEAAVQAALDTALAGRTSLVIAHRLSTVREADLIVVLQDGRIVEQGTHEELLAAHGLYAELHATQFAQAGRGRHEAAITDDAGDADVAAEAADLAGAGEER